MAEANYQMSGSENRKNFAKSVSTTYKIIDQNLPLGAAKKNRREGNPYLDQVKEIDKEIARLEKLLQKELKGSDNPTRDLKILNMKLKQDGTLNKNKLGISRKFWQRKGIGEQINSYKERRKQLTKFLGDAYIVSGRQNTPNIKGFTPTYMRDVDSNARLINTYYIRAFDEKANKRDRDIYDTVRSDMLGGTDTTGMTEKQINKLVQEQLPEGNMYRTDSKYYIGNRNEYGEKTKSASVTAETKDSLATNNTIMNNKSLSSSGGTVYGGGGWFTGNTDIRTSTGGSTTLTIHKGDDYKMAGRTIKAGDQVGVLTRSQRRNYNREVLGINT